MSAACTEFCVFLSEPAGCKTSRKRVQALESSLSSSQPHLALQHHRGWQSLVKPGAYGCKITLPIALRPASTFRASAVCTSGKLRSTCDEILPSAVHFTSFSRLARFFSALILAQ